MKKKSYYLCDNCKKNIVRENDNWIKTAFQCGTNKDGKTGTWCSKKCFNEYQGIKNKCEFDVAFNALGMPIFVCLTHGKINSKYHRGKEKCYQELAKKLTNLIS